MYHKLLHSLSLVVVLFTLICSCSNNYNKKQQPIDYISDDYNQILRLNNLNDFKSQLNSQSLLIDLQKTELLDSLQTLLATFTAIEKNGEAIIAFQPQEQFNYILVTDTVNLTVDFKNHQQFVADSLIVIKKQEITRTQIEQNYIYSITNGQHFLMSNDLNCLLKAVTNQQDQSTLVKDYSIIDKTKEVSLINYNHQFLTPIFNAATTDSLMSAFSGLSVMDVSFNSNSIRFSGVTTSNDSLDGLQLFHKTIPQTNEAIDLFPAEFDNVKSLTLSDYANFEARLTPRQKDSLPDFINLAVEVAYYQKDTDQAVALRFLDDNLVADKLLQSEKIETFRNTDLYHFARTNLFNYSFQPIIATNKVNVVFKLNNFFVFTETVEIAKNLISEYTINNTIAQSVTFQTISEHLSNESSLLILKNNKALGKLIPQLFGDTQNMEVKDYKLNAIQLIYEDNFAHINGVFSAQNTKKSTKNVEELFTVSLENDIINGPQFVTNHLNKEKDLVAQDLNNTLYLISNTGTVYWKKRLDGPILGEISQIDIYNNGRLQLVFVTKNKLYILDRNGRDVTGFPMNFNDNITQPLSVFDYDTNKNYRLLITQGNNLLMLDKTGKRVTGFKPDLNASTITKQPQHFRIGNKDYIVFAQGNSMKILDRTGSTRINVKKVVNFSENDIYLNNNKFTTITADGQLLQVDSKGAISTSGTVSAQNIQLDAGSKSVVTFSENKLIINNKVIELDFGTYSAPKFFYLNDKIYVAITDLQTSKVYLYDSQAKLIDHFPVYGNSTLLLDNSDKNNDIEAVTIGSNNSIILYQIQ